MGVLDAVTTAVHGFVARLRRNAIAVAICALCAVAVFILATWASVLALIPLVGEVYAALSVAGVFVLVILATLLWLQIASSRQQATAPTLLGMQAGGSQRQVQFAQIAMIVEAVLLGYSLSRRSTRR
jgi:threonine/homoserine/homoserine lactone efflux protein